MDNHTYYMVFRVDYGRGLNCRSPIASVGMILVAEKALHVALLVVHAIFVSRELIFRTMALDTVFGFFRRRPFRRRPFSVKVLVEIVHHGIYDLPCHLCATLIFLFGSDLGSGGQRPLRN